MRGREHLVFGITTSATLALAMYSPDSVYFAHPAIFTGLAAVGSLFPDIDHPDSTISRKCRLLSNVVSLFIKSHRTYTHDLALILPIAILLSTHYPIILGFFFGYIGHLIMDLLTVSGLPFFYLFQKKSIHITPKWARFKSGSVVAMLFTYLLSGGVLAAGYYFTNGTILDTLISRF